MCLIPKTKKECDIDEIIGYKVLVSINNKLYSLFSAYLYGDTNITNCNIIADTGFYVFKNKLSAKIYKIFNGNSDSIIKKVKLKRIRYYGKQSRFLGRVYVGEELIILE